MILNHIDATCSMEELTCQPIFINQYKGDRIEFIKKLFNTCDDDIEDHLNRTKAIIYNTYENSISFNKKLKSLKFKKVFFYKGNDHPIIYTWMTKITVKEIKQLAKLLNCKYDNIEKSYYIIYNN